MKKGKTGKIIRIILFSGILISGSLIFFAYANTWGKTELEFNIHINEKLVLQSVYGESPTFAIWLENPENGLTQTIFVTYRAGKNDWEGKASVPAALPKWDEIRRIDEQKQSLSGEAPQIVDVITGATPKPGYFITRAQVEPGSKWICWIEMNLSGDYNDYYREFDQLNMKTDEYGSGQPALVYKAEITATLNEKVVPDAIGMSLFNAQNGKIIQPTNGITTALDIFDEMSIKVVKPKPRIIK